MDSNTSNGIIAREATVRAGLCLAGKEEPCLERSVQNTVRNKGDAREQPGETGLGPSWEVYSKQESKRYRQLHVAN